MSSTINYNKVLGENKIYTPNFSKQNAINRSHTMVSLPCEPISDPIMIFAEPSSENAYKPLFGNQRHSSFGLSRTKDHPTNTPLLPVFDGFKDVTVNR